jgi:hypothetical protein
MWYEELEQVNVSNATHMYRLSVFGIPMELD